MLNLWMVWQMRRWDSFHDEEEARRYAVPGTEIMPLVFVEIQEVAS